MSSHGKIDINNAIFVLIDIQEKFIPHIYQIDRIIKNANILLEGSRILDIPTMITEQYPQGLGETAKEINLGDLRKTVITKTAFDCFGDKGFVEGFWCYERSDIIIYGIESHVCVFQTALSALSEKFNVFAVKDAISSRTKENWEIGIERMRQSGVFIVSTEMILFQLMKTKEANGFKDISKLVK